MATNPPIGAVLSAPEEDRTTPPPQGAVPTDVNPPVGALPVDVEPPVGATATQPEQQPAQSSEQSAPVFRGGGPAAIQANIQAQRSPEEIAKDNLHTKMLDALSADVKAYDDEFTFTERMGIRLGRGYTRRAANGLLNELTMAREELARLKAGDEETQRRAAVMQSPTGIPGMAPGALGGAVENRIKLLEEAIPRMENEYMSITSAVHNPQIGLQNPREVPDHPAMLAAQQAQAAGDDELVNKILTQFFPEMAAETALPSLTQAGPAQLLVPAGAGAGLKFITGSTAAARAGFVAGTGVVSGHVESQASFAEYLSEQGVDLQDIGSIREALDDPEIVSKGRDFAGKRAASVAMWDMLGGYLASKTLVPPVIKDKLARNIFNGASQLALQPATGALGEATAQVAADQEFNSLEVKLELLGEIPSAVTEPIVFHIADKIGKQPKDMLHVGDILDAFVKNPEVTEGEALVGMREVAERGMTDDEAVMMLKNVPGFNWDDATIDQILNDPGVGKSEHYTNRPLHDVVVQNTFFENLSGMPQQGQTILDGDVNQDGTVWWSTDQMIDKPDDGIDVTISSTTLRIIDETVQDLEARLNVLQAAQSPQTAINELTNQIESLKENRARVARDIRLMAEVRPRIHQWLQDMVNTFTPGQDVMVIEDNAIMDISQPGVLGAAGNTYGPNGKRIQVIQLNTRALLDLQAGTKTWQKKGRGAAAMTTVLGHEYGHAVMQMMLDQLPPEVLLAIKAEHRNWLARQLKDLDRPFNEFLKEKKDPFEVETIFKNLAGTYNDRLGDIPDLPYHLSLREFLADQMARQIGDRETNVVGPMMSRVLPRIQTLLRRYFNLNKPQMVEGATYETFLKYLRARNQRESLEGIRHHFSAEEKALPDDPQGSKVLSMLKQKGLEIPAEVRDEVLSGMDRYNKLMRYGLGLLQLAKENKHIQGLQDYVKAVHEHWTTKSNWNDEAMQTMNAWRRLGKRAGDELGRFLLELTVASDELGRSLTNEEIDALVKEKKIDFGGKTEQAWEVYQKIKSDFNMALEELYLIEKERINIEWAEVESNRKVKLLELDNLFDQLRNRDYFPLSRFGKWGIAMKATKPVEINGRKYTTGEVVHMELYENKKQRNKGSGALRRQFGPSVQETFFVVDDEMMPFTGLPMAIMRQLKQNPKLALTPDQKQQLQDMIDTMSPTNSIAKRMLERKGTAGFSMDAQRGYANYMLQMGGHIAKMKHIGAMDAAIDSVRKSARYLGQRGIVNDKRHEIAAHLQRHQSYLLAPENEWGAMRALAFHWFLGYNVKSAIVNLTQVPLVSYPYLAARKELTGRTPVASDSRAIKALTVAMKDVANVFRKGEIKYSIDEQEMMQQLVAEGIIDESLATELANQAHSDWISQNMPKETAFSENVHFRAQQFLRGSTWMFQTAEKFNRRVTALATYRLAREQGLDAQTAIDEAREALRATQFEYARWNRAAFMRGKAGVFFVFMQYIQNVLYFVTRDPGNTRYMLMMLMAAGLQGLPGAEDLLDLFDFGRRQFARWTKSGDPRQDTREDLRNMIMTLDSSPELIMHGLSAQSFGLGLPAVSDMLGTSIPSLSFESSISAGRVVPGWEALLSPNNLSGVGAVEGAKDVLGAAITVPLNMYRWLGDPDPSNLRAFERMAPSVLRGPARTLRILKEGGLYDRGGKLIADFDMSNPEHIGELIGLSLGAQPTRIVRAQEARWAEREATEFYAQRRANLLRDYFYAMEERRLMGDTDAVKNAVAAIKNFNERVPKGQELINYGSAYGRWKVQQGLDQAGIGRRKLDVPLLRDIQGSFPAATEERIK